MVKKDIHVLRIKHQHFSTKIFSARHIVQIFQTFFVICEYCQNNTICSSYICKNIHDSIITLQHIQVGTYDNPFFYALSMKLMEARENLQSLIQSVVTHADGTRGHLVVRVKLLFWKQSHIFARYPFRFHISQKFCYTEKIL